MGYLEKLRADFGSIARRRSVRVLRGRAALLSVADERCSDLAKVIIYNTLFERNRDKKLIPKISALVESETSGIGRRKALVITEELRTDLDWAKLTNTLISIEEGKRRRAEFDAWWSESEDVLVWEESEEHFVIMKAVE